MSAYWGYGLFVDKPGNFVGKPMSACTGREIMTELLGHLKITTEAGRIRNLAFTGQFCELPHDVVFTVEYSVRSAQTAVYELLGLKRQIPAVYQGKFDPRVLFKAFMALHDLHA
jgi:oleate hydratase